MNHAELHLSHYDPQAWDRSRQAFLFQDSIRRSLLQDVPPKRAVFDSPMLSGKEMDSMLELYNTMSRRKEPFKPLNDRKVKMFTCGPSIYRRPHMGNYRSFVWEDVLQRYLAYLGYHVERVINFTDVEDKAIAEAQNEGRSVETITNQTAEQFFRDASVLKMDLPEFIPRSSTSVDQAVKLIQILLEKGYAYRHGKDVFFDPLKFKGFGRLYGLDMSKWPKEKRRFRRDTYPGRRWNLGDFILWHGAREGDALYWDTEIGRGRPSWNIQDPAMITKHLGFRIDISCGGVDNLYRHHDYNLAVIEAVSGEEFARYWVHGEHLLVDGKKMSKSKGNIIYPQDLLDEGHSAEQIRFYLMAEHHRQVLNMTREGFRKRSEQLDAFQKAVNELLKKGDGGARSDPSAQRLIQDLTPLFEEKMNDDLNVKGAFDAVSENISRLAALKRERRLADKSAKEVEKALRRIDQVLHVMDFQSSSRS